MPRAIICGAGLAGCALAALLHDRGWQVTLVEARTDFGRDGFTFTIQTPGWKTLEALGVADSLKAEGYRLPAIRILSSSGRTLKEGTNVDRFLPGATQVYRWKVVRALRERAAPCEFLAGKTITSFDLRDDSVAVQIADESTPRICDLLVGADGVGSRIRSMAQMGESATHETWSAAVLGPSRGDALQVRFGTNNHFVIAPMGEPKSHWVLTSRTKFPSADEPNAVREAFRRGLRAIGEDPAIADIEMPLLLRNKEVSIPFWSKAGRLVLLGDAAHALLHTSGQGGTLALGDALCLAQKLDGNTVPQALAEYEKERRPVIEKARIFSHQAMRFNLPPWWLAPMRDFFVWALPVKLITPHHPGSRSKSNPAPSVRA